MKTEASVESSSDPRQEERRSLLRRVGPVLLAGGVLFLILGLVNLARAVNSYGEPRMLWCFFVALPMLWLGFVQTAAGFRQSK